MKKISRSILAPIEAVLARGKSVLLLGPRQVGKTTLLAELAPTLTLSLARPALRQQYERDIEAFSQEIEALAQKSAKPPLVAVDEIQKIPDLMDAVQDLIDRNIAQFVLTGSSARKLRTHHQINWLPGRVIYFHMDPLSMTEMPHDHLDVTELLIYGSLPGIVVEKNNAMKEQDLRSYVITYLEEEIRQEALVRKIGDFARFVELAAAESGQISNFNRLSQDIGVAQTTIAAYYQILEDCLIAERIDPILMSHKIRRRLVKSPKYLLFDLGIRRIAAREGVNLPEEIMGKLFEQWIGLEILRWIRIHDSRARLNYWRDLEGREVDWVIQMANQLLPIEVKWTKRPTLKDARYLKLFLNDYEIQRGYIICRCDKVRQLDEQIIALPWQQLADVFQYF